MGFDVLYLPPDPSHRPHRPQGPQQHPDRRRGRSRAARGPSGAHEGGHTAIHPELGTIEDFAQLVAEVRAHGMELALDYALQCSPDHPWVTEHPEWFHHRPDGSIAYAENPPKVYQDIDPINFWPAAESDRVALWEACREIMRYWISQGVAVFRVDNPHTKPIAFWEWLISSIQEEHPEVIFLSEAFTRPKVMARLAEAGFSQSYTYFTWRTDQHGPEGLWAYLDELAHGPVADYMRPNFWPNTPDILSGPLRLGPPGRVRPAAGAGGHPEPLLRGLQRLRAVRERSGLGPERGVPQLGEVRDQGPGLHPARQPGPADDRPQRHPPPPPRPPPPAVHSLPPDHQPRDHRLLEAERRRDRRRAHGRQPRSALAPGGDPAPGSGRPGPARRSPFAVVDELSGERYQWFGWTPYVRLDPAYRVAHVLDLRAAG